MANSKYEYVKSMERRVVAEEGFMVVRLDGRGFTGFCSAHELEKPSDDRALHLMNAAAVAVVEEFGEIVLAYGVSDVSTRLVRTPPLDPRAPPPP